MSGHRRSRTSSDDASPSSMSPCHRTSMPTKYKHTHAPAGHHRRRFKRSSRASSSMDSPRADSCPSWAILNLAGARRDDFAGDRTTSASSFTSNGDKVSISFELVAPPGTSVLCLHWPGGPGPLSSTRPDVIAAHRDVVLLEMSRRFGGDVPSDSPVDYFVYQASTDGGGGAGEPSSRRSSLSLLPLHYHEELRFGGKPMQCLLSKECTGIMSSSSSFVVAELSMKREAAGSTPAISVNVFRSVSGEWEAFKNLHVRGANGGRDLNWWHTDAIVPYGRGRFLIWVDYYRGMILADLSSSPESEKKIRPPPPSPPPRLRYVLLPVDTVAGDPDDYAYHDRGCPANSRSVCGTRYGLKFVSVDRKHCSDWGVGHANVLTWNHTFRITTWSLREDDYTWRKDLTMYEEEFWDVLGSEKRFPRVTPEYPVVSMENPDAVCFRLKKNHYRYDEPTWMIEVDMRKKVLLGATSYSDERSSSYNYEHTINSARIHSCDISLSTELPRYLDGTGQAYKRRRH